MCRQTRIDLDRSLDGAFDGGFGRHGDVARNLDRVGSDLQLLDLNRIAGLAAVLEGEGCHRWPVLKTSLLQKNLFRVADLVLVTTKKSLVITSQSDDVTLPSRWKQ